MTKLHQTLLQESFDNQSTVSFLSVDEKRVSPARDILQESSKVSTSVLLQSLPNVITLYFLGAYSSLEVQSAFGLVMVLNVVIGYGMYEGLAAGMESLLSTLSLKVSTVIYQRTLVLAALLLVPISAALLLAKYCFFPYMLHQAQSTIAGNLGLLSVPSIFFSGVYMCSRSLMNSRHSFNNQVISNVSAAVFHIIACWFIFGFCGFTVYGCVIAKFITDIFNLNLFFYLTKIQDELVFQHFRSVKINQIMPLAYTLLSRGIVMTLEISVYETFTFQTVSLSYAEITTHVIATNIHNCGYFINIGMCIVVYLKVSKYIINNKKKSIQYIRAGVVLLCLMVIAYSAVVIFTPFKTIFSNESEVLKQVFSLTPLIVIFMALDYIQVYISSLSRGLGKHEEAFKHFIVSYVCIGEPVCFALKWMFPEWGLKNVWLAMIISVLIYDIRQGKILYEIDLDHSARVIELEAKEQEEENARFLASFYPELASQKSVKSCCEFQFEMTSFRNSGSDKRHSYLSHDV